MTGPTTDMTDMADMTDVMWVAVCAALVLVMQAGFLCLEAGLTRAKNSINVAVKNLADFAVAAGLFWAIGFGVMFGATRGGWAGTTLFAPDVGPGGAGVWTAAFFLYQVMFCGTAVTIISGAVAERVRFGGYLWVAALTSALIYPVFGHWAWGGALVGGAGGWLQRLGFADFAGSTVVHAVGGWVALVACLVVGPRAGRFGDGAGGAGARSAAIHGSNLPLAMLGALLLLVGWLGFNGGGKLALTPAVPGILANTVLAAVAGAVASMALGWASAGRPHPTGLVYGFLAGLVAITAGCHAVAAAEAVAIGAVGAVACSACAKLLERLEIDDAVGAVPIHLAAGVWGTLAVGLLGDLDVLGTGLSRPGQVAVQAAGVAACGALSVGVAGPLIWLANRWRPLRVDAEAERVGLNVAEHGAPSDLADLASTIELQARTKDLSLRAKVEPFTEVGEIARRYNQMVDELAQTTLNIEDFRRMTANVPGMLFRFEMTPAGVASFAFASEGCRTFYGCGPEELVADVGVATAAIVAEDAAAFEAAVGQSHESLAPFRWSGRVRHRDGGVRWAEAVSNPLRLRDGTTRWDGVMIDVTPLREAEAQLHAAKASAEAARAAAEEARAAAEEANAAKSEFLANMSHEIRTPLHGMLSFAGFGLKRARTAGPAKLEGYFQKIDASGQRLLALVNDLLDLAKFEAGKMTFDFAPADLAAAVEAVYDEFGSLLSERSVKVAFDRPPSPVTAEVDLLRMMQVVRNLVNNAIKFSPADAAIDVSLGRDDLAATLRVRDRGPGIPPAELGAIFEKFNQSSATRSGAGGTGLGLSICTEIVHAHGGTIAANNHPGGGAVFTVRLPLRRGEPVAPPDAALNIDLGNPAAPQPESCHA